MAEVADGLYESVCIGVWDVGTQMTKGKFAGLVHQCVFLWELPGGLTVSKKYTASLSDKANLRKDLQAWRGRRFTDEELRGFSLRGVVGARCQLQVTNNDDGWPQISAIVSSRDNSWEAHNPLLFFELGDQIPEGTPNWIVAMIQNCEEMKGVQAGGSQGSAGDEETQHHHGDDTVPF